MFKENSQFTPESNEVDSFNPRSRMSSAICGVGTAFPPQSFTQSEVGDRLGIQNTTVQKLLQAKHIRTRHLYLREPPQGQKAIHDESQAELNQKFDDGVLDIGVRAATLALSDSPLRKEQIDFLICVTSTGFRSPGVSSMIARALDLKRDLYRLDVVGMGCNAGMSALRTADALTRTGMRGLLVCCEINSAIYLRDESIRTGIVNSLFGDGASAFVLEPESLARENAVHTEILGFSSYTIPEQWAAMRFEWDKEQSKWSFGLSKQIPFVVGENLKVPVEAVLEKHGFEKSEIKHWTIHTGGAAVIDGAKKSLGISEHAVRHTRSVLRDYGNISSGSFLVSHQRLLEEGTIRDGDLGIMAAMGPGATLEACLVRYHIA